MKAIIDTSITVVPLNSGISVNINLYTSFYQLTNFIIAKVYDIFAHFLFDFPSFLHYYDKLIGMNIHV